MTARPATLLASAPDPSPEQVDAYDAGAAAYRAGHLSSVIPHDPRSELGVLWLRGYCDARRDDRYGPRR